MNEYDDIVLDDYAFDTNEPIADVPDETTTQTPAPEDSKKVAKIKFDDALLLDTKGLPLLRNESRYIQFQGKGHEAADLKKLMTYYTIWANNLYPKFRFKDFAKKVQKPASTSRVKVVVAEWQDEYKDKIQARREAFQELSGETVGEADGSYRQEEDSSDDDNRPLFIPISKEVEETMAKNKKTPKKTKAPTNPKKKYRSSGMINSSDDENDTPTKEPRTITFSDSEDEEDNMIIKKKAKTSAKNGREHALAILTEKRKQRLQAQQRLQQEEEEVQAKAVVPEADPYSSNDKELDFEEELRKIMSGKSSSNKDKAATSNTESSKTQDNDKTIGLYDDIVMEDVDDIDLDNIQMENIEDDVVLNNDDDPTEK